MTILKMVAFVGEYTWWDQIPYLGDFILLMLGFALIAVMIWFVKGTRGVQGFVIHVDEADITFSGQFPPAMQAVVIEFLRQDVALEGAYEGRGRWEGEMLIVAVKGEHARTMEQRIRNFLKLNLKAAR